jgi:hypothetical protein
MIDKDTREDHLVTIMRDQKDRLEQGYRLLNKIGEMIDTNPSQRVVEAWHEARELLLQEDIRDEYQNKKD